MKRRHFFSLLAFLGISFSSNLMATSNANFEEGVHYKLLPDNARSMVTKGTVQEFFFYGCSHCMEMEKPLHDWLATKPKIQLEQIPAVFQSPSWAFLARTYYGLKNSQQIDYSHKNIFDIFIVDRARPKNEQELASLIAAKASNFNKENFIQQFSNDDTNVAVNRAAKLSALYQLEAVPTFIINGKYMTDLTMTGNHANLFALIELLANK